MIKVLSSAIKTWARLLDARLASWFGFSQIPAVSLLGNPDEGFPLSWTNSPIGLARPGPEPLTVSRGLHAHRSTSRTLSLGVVSHDPEFVVGELPQIRHVHLGHVWRDGQGLGPKLPRTQLERAAPPTPGSLGFGVQVFEVDLARAGAIRQAHDTTGMRRLCSYCHATMLTQPNVMYISVMNISLLQGLHFMQKFAICMYRVELRAE